MDGLSAAASGIAVLSLAIQLVDSVREARSFLSRVTDAPKELERLLDLLEQLESMLESIGVLMERQTQQNKFNDTLISESVLKALTTCNSRLVLLRDIVEISKKTSSGSRFSRSLGSFKLACKTNVIEEFENKFQHAITILNLAMTMNFTALHFHQTGAFFNGTSTVIGPNVAHLLPSPHSCSNAVISDSNKYVDQPSNGPLCHSVESNTRSPRKMSTIARKYGTIFGTFYWRSVVFSTNGVGGASVAQILGSESSLTFIPSFFSRCIEMHYTNSFGYVSRELRTRPLIPFNHPAFKMCSTGDVQGLQNCFSGGILSPYSTDEDGFTLLHAAVHCAQVGVCKLLLDLGSSTDAVDTDGSTPSAYLLSWVDQRERGSIIDLLRLFSSQKITSDFSEISPRLFHATRYLDVQLFEYIINEWVTETNINEFWEHPLALGLRSMARDSSRLPSQLKAWITVIRRLLKMGGKLHQHSQTRADTFLDVLFSVSTHPFESKFSGDVWLHILHGAGVDVTSYLETEIMLHSHDHGQPLLLDNWDQKRQLLVSLEKPLSVAWTWWTPPESVAFDLMEEFKYFYKLNWGFYRWGIEHEAVFWPFRGTNAQLCEYMVKRGKATSEERKTVELASERYRRRQLKKSIKLSKARGLWLAHGVPGSWID